MTKSKDPIFSRLLFWLGLLALMTYTTVLDIARHVIGAAA